MKTVAFAVLLAIASIALMDVAVPTPAAAGWCYERCGIKRPKPPRTTECITTRDRYGTVTTCSSN